MTVARCFGACLGAVFHSAVVHQSEEKHAEPSDKLMELPWRPFDFQLIIKNHGTDDSGASCCSTGVIWREQRNEAIDGCELIIIHAQMDILTSKIPLMISDDDPLDGRIGTRSLGRICSMEFF